MAIDSLYLARLVEQGRLIVSGKGPARCYHAAGDRASCVTGPRAETSGVAEPVAEGYVSVSEAGAELRRLVRQLLSQRTPVGYNREFLDAYAPNETNWLSPQTRERLHALGRSSATDTALAVTYARRILDRLLVDLSWASSRLEGNTYSRLDTQNLIEFGRFAEGKDRLEAQMILNHKAAIEMLVEGADETGFDRYTFQNLHALLAENLLADPGAGGRFRELDVGIAGTFYQPSVIPRLIVECLDTLLAKARAIKDPFEQAFFVMVQLPYLQPFEDVNKRISRLAANISLIRANLAPLSFVDVPEAAYVGGTLAVYELNRIDLLRDVFVWAYERSCRRFTLLDEALPTPDPLRLRYRESLARVVSTMVRNCSAVDSATIRALAGEDMEAADMSHFVAMAVNELLHLREGNLARYRLRLAEYRRWRRVTPLETSSS